MLQSPKERSEKVMTNQYKMGEQKKLKKGRKTTGTNQNKE
jgi:hypothetical protein